MPDFEHRTSWAVAFVEDWREVLPLRIHEEGRYWTHLRALVRYMAEVSAGKWLVAHLDLHSNMDALEAIRGAARLCTDLYDCPDVVAEANDQVRALYPSCLRYSTATETWTAWAPGAGSRPSARVGSTRSSVTLRPWWGPSILALHPPRSGGRVESLDHCIYHWDGPSSLSTWTTSWPSGDRLLPMGAGGGTAAGGVADLLASGAAAGQERHGLLLGGGGPGLPPASATRPAVLQHRGATARSWSARWSGLCRTRDSAPDGDALSRYVHDVRHTS